MRAAVQHSLASKIIASMDLFQDLTIQDQREVVTALVQAKYPPGAIIVSPRSDEKKLCIIRAGTVRVLRIDAASNAERPLAWVIISELPAF